MVNRIKETLDKRGMTQKQLAEMTGATEAAISRYVNDKRTPRVNTACIIAQALNVDMGWLFYIGKDNK